MMAQQKNRGIPGGSLSKWQFYPFKVHAINSSVKEILFCLCSIGPKFQLFSGYLRRRAPQLANILGVGTHYQLCPSTLLEVGVGGRAC